MSIPNPPRTPDTTPALRVGTFNVRWDAPEDGSQRWELRRPRFLALLRGWGPDVLGLQEPLQHQLDQILAGLPAYAAVGVGRDDGIAAGEFCPILFRRDRFDNTDGGTFWLSETPETPGSAGWGNRIPRICTWVRLTEREAGRTFYVYNVHLDHESQRAREKSTELLLDRIRQRTGVDPVLVTGDFNAGPGNPALLRLMAADSPVPVNALAASGPEAAESGTFHGFTGRAQAGPIDYLFLSPEWQVSEARVLHGDGGRPFPSDHFPVAATVQRR